MGWLDYLTCLHEFGCPWDESTCADAAENKHMDCLKYAHTHGCPWDALTTGCTLKSRHTECFTYARDHGCPWDAATCSTETWLCCNLLMKVAAPGTKEHARILRAPLPWTASITRTSKAVRGTHLFVRLLMVYAHQNGYPWDERICAVAAERGHLACLVYAHEQGCAWNEETCKEAAGNDHIGCLVYEQGCPWDVNTSVAASCKSAVFLIYCHKHGCPCNEEVVTHAAHYCKLECLRYTLEHGYPGREIACASLYSSLECLKYLREEQMCPWDVRVANNFTRSFIYGTDCLQYCLEKDCLADENTLLLAVHILEKMKVLRDHSSLG